MNDIKQLNFNKYYYIKKENNTIEFVTLKCTHLSNHQKIILSFSI